VSILDITGKPYDSLCNTLGLNPTILRYNLRVLTPHPVVAYRELTQKTDVPSDYNSGENYQTWDSSIPQATLRSCLGPRWQEIIQPSWADQKWDLKMPNAKTFTRVRVFGIPAQDALGDRYKLTFVGMGEDDV
jgi:hypothetical protein